MANLLDQLKSYTTVVADSGDINSIKQFKPTDSTTNPSLIAAAAQMPEYQAIVDGVLQEAREKAGESASDKDVAAARVQDAGRRLRPQDPEDRSGPRLHRSRRASRATTPKRPSRRLTTSSSNMTMPESRPRARADQDRLHLGRHQGRRAAGKGRHPLQPDAAVRPAPGDRLRGGEGHADLAVRRAHSRLVQEGHGQGLHRRGRSRRAVGDRRSTTTTRSSATRPR